MIENPSPNTSQALERFVEWLNSQSSDAPKSRESENALRLRIETVIEWFNDWHKYKGNQETEAQRAGSGIRFRAVNRMLERCLVFPQLVVIKPGQKTVVAWTPDSSARDRRYIELLQLVIHSFELDLLERVRKCRCCRWFFAKKSGKEFHSDVCRKRAYAEGPRGKEVRRKYMKKYMRGYRKENF